MRDETSPPAPAAISSQDRMNIFTQPYIPEHNAAILATPKSLLGGGLLGQRHYILTIATNPNPCPSCGRRISQVEACGGLLNYHVDKSDAVHEYRCTGCQRPLSWTVYLFGGSGWRIDFEREALEKRQGQALDADSSQPANVPRYIPRPAD